MKNRNIIKPRMAKWKYCATFTKRAREVKTFCPLKREVRIVVTSTLRFAKVVANKFARSGSTQVESDLAENHGRRVARS